MTIYENYGFGKWREGCGTVRASGGDNGGGSEMLCVGCARERRGGVIPTLTGDHENRVTDYTALAVHPKTTGSLCANSHPGSYTGQDEFNDMLPVMTSEKAGRRYIVRRLTPLECCRLQGFPDWWTEGCEKYPISMEHAKNKTIFLHVNPTGAIEGKDSPKYKMWGNGIALPCALHVMQGVARALEEEK